jgi:type IV pilus assembly protein PilA
MRVRRASEEGFTLIELLLVVAIMLTLAALAIPSLIRSRTFANEGSAVNTLRVLYSAENSYATVFGNSYSPDLNSLGKPAGGATISSSAADLVDDQIAGRLAGGSPTTLIKNGYLFTYTPSGSFPNIRSFTITADPTTRGKTGVRSFFLDNSGVTRVSTSATASASDPPLK